jgi:hypothetical protein
MRALVKRALQGEIGHNGGPDPCKHHHAWRWMLDRRPVFRLSLACHGCSLPARQRCPRRPADDCEHREADVRPRCKLTGCRPSAFGQYAHSVLILSVNSSISNSLRRLTPNRPSHCSCAAYACFSNRPFGVKRFQAIHRYSVDVAHGLVLLFGIGTKALPSWDSRTRRNNLLVGLAVRRTAGPSRHTISPHPSSREGHHSTARWSSSFLLSHSILRGSHATATSRVHRNSVPSIHMRCMITASRRANATIAFFIPRRLAICIAQALSQDHFTERTSTIWAAS